MASVTRRSLPMEAKRREIIRLRYEGHTLDRTAELVGLAGPSSVQHHENAWLAERTPSVEVTESRRQFQLAGIDAVRAKLFEALAGEVDLASRLSVVDRLGKLWDREARLLGLDLTQQIQIGINVSAEALAELFADHAGSPVIEGTAVEIEAGDANA